ncbi:uncharacterized protein MYCFIDRAFT_178162 [Pseudocercospora fijiensis CIRAD86]|uniref:WW domain-containing protein n=1 Tax=Pseudocercospora fijiensis (strain CIRAD86) TaxID=383855 RepID=M3A4N8_PSEFD|nr:uncharacterized protein MYCFIDRAFT_178162 [Pseudocercospora fijiensis CIRAD86]EME79571.1 hypothetical protein MYCFIDRAFT_178162 [Pseudocercospora fijiensis CIRAD86]
MLRYLKNLGGEDHKNSAASTYELPLGWSFYTDPASQRLHYIDHSTGRTYDKPPPPRFKFDPNKTPSPREFDTWSQSSGSSISSLDLGTPLIFTKTTTVSAVSEPCTQDSPTGTPTLDARIQKRTEYNNTASPSPSTKSPTTDPEQLYSLTTSHTISIPSNTDPNPCCCSSHISSSTPCPQRTCCDRTIDQPLVPCGYTGEETERELRFYADRQCPVCGKWILECEHDRVGDLRSTGSGGGWEGRGWWVLNILILL